MPNNNNALRSPVAVTQDWRILSALALYRLGLLAILLALQEYGYTPSFFVHIQPQLIHYICLGYALLALLLLPSIYWRRPNLPVQINLHFALDAAGTTLLVYALGGVGNGMGALLITPMVGCALISSTRSAFFNAILGSLMMVGEELMRQALIGPGSGEMTTVIILCLIFFGTTVASNAVARRARRGEALAARTGSDLASLSELNNRIIETMETGVLVIEATDTIRLWNEAARRLLNAAVRLRGVGLAQAFPALNAALTRWRQADFPDDTVAPIEIAGADEVVPRFTSLGVQMHAPVLIMLDSASRMREQAQQIKLAALGRLSASIAHEIRNPLSAINHASQLLAESSTLGEEDRRMLNMIERHSTRIDCIVNDVLSLSRREIKMSSEIALRPWLERTLTQYAEAHADSARPIELDTIADDLMVRFDPNHLQQVMHNLWDNSFQHGGIDGRVIKVFLRGWRLPGSFLPCLEISDDGPGVRDEVADKIFEPFYTTARTGTGLGLYLARELCEYNRARLQYKTRASGACFRIIFADA